MKIYTIRTSTKYCPEERKGNNTNENKTKTNKNNIKQEKHSKYPDIR